MSVKRKFIKKTIYEIAEELGKNLAEKDEDLEFIRDVRKEMAHRTTACSKVVDIVCDSYLDKKVKR